MACAAGVAAAAPAACSGRDLQGREPRAAATMAAPTDKAKVSANDPVIPLTGADWEHVYEPAEDTYLFMDALEASRQAVKCACAGPSAAELLRT